jgi:hypothetical protein
MEIVTLRSFIKVYFSAQEMLYDVVSLLFESTHVYRNTSQIYISFNL